MMKVFVDLETVSPIDLSNKGLHNYANNKDTHITMISFKDLEGTYLVTRPEFSSRPIDSKVLKKLVNYLNDKDVVWHAFNAKFDVTLLQLKAQDFIQSFKDDSLKFTNTDLKSHCIMLDSRIIGSKGGLGAVALNLECIEEKSELGKKAMLQVCMGYSDPNLLPKSVMGFDAVPIKIGDFYFTTGVEIYDVIESYCITDTEVAHEIYNKTHEKSKEVIGSWQPVEDIVRTSTKESNINGILIDAERVNQLIDIQARISLQSEQFMKNTFKLKSAGANKAILRRLDGMGYNIGSLDDFDVQVSYDDIDNSEEIKDIIKTLKLYKKISLKKVLKIPEKLTSDNKLTDTIEYFGARTGRFTARGFQIQNLPSPTETLKLSEKALKKYTGNSLPIDVNDIPLLVNLIRSIIIAPKGHKLFISDLAQIELRLTMWYCGQNKAVKSFEKGKDLYIEFANTIYNRDDIKKPSKERDVAKTSMLALQYGTSAKALKDMLYSNGLVVGLKKATQIKIDFDKRFPKIVRAHKKFGSLIRSAISSKKDLVIPLKSGRKLDYGHVFMDEITNKKTKEIRNTSCYKYGSASVGIYGSKLFQNMIQAEARDIICAKIAGMQVRNNNVLFSIHDEVVYSVRNNRNALKKINSDWEVAGSKLIGKLYKGLPIDYESKMLKRFYK